MVFNNGKVSSKWHLIKIGYFIGGILFSLGLSLVSTGMLAQPTSQPPPLPVAAIHSMPPTLTQWKGGSNLSNSDNYFDQIQSTDIGYLVWSQFPIQVYRQPVPGKEALPFDRQQAEQWWNAVNQAVEEWSMYLPCRVTEKPEQADILLWRSPPPMRLGSNGQLPRFRTAETHYEVYLRHLPNQSPTLTHRMTIRIRPNQSPVYLLATARHELGHALGIWGHSLLETDALFFSQVRHPPAISQRDINTLIRIYQQPTRLGWSVPLSSAPQ